MVYYCLGLYFCKRNRYRTITKLFEWENWDEDITTLTKAGIAIDVHSEFLNIISF